MDNLEKSKQIELLAQALVQCQRRDKKRGVENTREKIVYNTKEKNDLFGNLYNLIKQLSKKRIDIFYRKNRCAIDKKLIEEVQVDVLIINLNKHIFNAELPFYCTYIKRLEFSLNNLYRKFNTNKRKVLLHEKVDLRLLEFKKDKFNISKIDLLLDLELSLKKYNKKDKDKLELTLNQILVGQRCSSYYHKKLLTNLLKKEMFNYAKQDRWNSNRHCK